MTSNLLPFDPKLAKSELNKDGLEVLKVGHSTPPVPVLFIGMDLGTPIVREDDAVPVPASNLRLRPRMVKRWIVANNRYGFASREEAEAHICKRYPYVVEIAVTE